MKRLKTILFTLILLIVTSLGISLAYEYRSHKHIEVRLMINSVKGVWATYCPTEDAIVTHSGAHNPRVSEVRIQ